MPRQPTLLVTLTGRDRPGVTAALFDQLSTCGVDVLDIEQIVVRGRLVLAVLIAAPRDTVRVIRGVEQVAAELGMEVEVDSGEGDNAPRPDTRGHVTVLGQPLHAAAVSAVAGRIADLGANIDRIVRMARYPVTAIEMEVSGADLERLRVALATEAARQRVDVAVQAAGLTRRGHRLVVMDVDSTLVQDEAIDLLAERAGAGAAVAEITRKAVFGKIDFADALRRRVALLEGLDWATVEQVYDDLRLAPGARTLVRTLTRLGYRFGLVSGGFSVYTDRLAADLGIAYSRANRLEVERGRLTGRLVEPVLDRKGKADALRGFAAEAGIPLDRTVAIGDGANDLDMLTTAGLGIAFNAKPMVQKEVAATVNVPYLDAIMYLLGISREEVEAADRAHGVETPAPEVPGTSQARVLRGSASRSAAPG